MIRLSSAEYKGYFFMCFFQKVVKCSFLISVMWVLARDSFKDVFVYKIEYTVMNFLFWKHKLLKMKNTSKNV